MLTVVVAALALSATAEPTRIARDIDAFCRGASPCVKRQRQSLRYFLNLSVVFDAPQPRVGRCMRSGKIGKLVDWTIAERCMRSWSKGRRALLPGGGS